MDYLEMKVLQIKLFAQFVSSVTSQSINGQLSNHVGRSLARTALIASELFLRNIRVIPGVLVKEIQCLLSRESF